MLPAFSPDRKRRTGHGGPLSSGQDEGGHRARTNEAMRHVSEEVPLERPGTAGAHHEQVTRLPVEAGQGSIGSVPLNHRSADRRLRHRHPGRAGLRRLTGRGDELRYPRGLRPGQHRRHHPAPQASRPQAWIHCSALPPHADPGAGLHRAGALRARTDDLDRLRHLDGRRADHLLRILPLPQAFQAQRDAAVAPCCRFGTDGMVSGSACRTRWPVAG